MSDEDDPPDQAPQAAAGTTPMQRARTLRPRRVVLRRDEAGNYQILQGNRVIQGFCQEFEEITGFAMGVDLQQQVNIYIDPVGRRRHARYPDRTEEDRPDALIRHRDPGEAVMTRATDQGIEQEEVALFSAAHPGEPTVTQTWQDEAREHLIEQITLMQHMIDLLARV